jgi:IMP cyclohydrolase
MFDVVHSKILTTVLYKLDSEKKCRRSVRISKILVDSKCFKGILRWSDNNSMFRRLSCNRATSKE